ncbi:MAG: TRAP transporter substrate-binding protein [Oscillospiraceae bacterium]|nr:TRAP transporter substrate-binding protein [Oscillospiraceae bacterium]
MKKILAIVMALTMIFALASVSASAADAPIVLKIGVSTAETDPRNIAAQMFADEIAEKTDGAVTAEVYPAGQLGGDGQLVESMAVNDGTVDIVITDASNFGTIVADMNISGLPFLFSDFDSAFAFMDSEVEAAAEAELLDLTGVRVLTHYSNGFRCVTNSKGAVETPDDMKGMLIRTPENPVIMATMSALGANPQPLAFSELYQALQQKTYDAQENPIPIIYNNKLFEVQDYLSVTNHIYSGLCFAISGSAWDSLTAEQQEIVAAAAATSGEWQCETIRQQTDDLVASLEEEGMKINFPELAPFQAAAQSVIEENALGISDELLTALAEMSEKEAA